MKLATAPTDRSGPLTILQRIANKDRTAVKDCIDIYGKFIWAMAQKLTDSPEEAEAAVQAIFIDIWRCPKSGGGNRYSEAKLISQIAVRRLTEHLQGEQKGTPEIGRR